MRQKLAPAEGGLYKLRDDLAQEIDKTLPESVRNNPIRFIPTVEIATIYKKLDKVRKLHQLLVAPSFEAVSTINAKLERIGNLKADGRPILGLDSKELLKIVLESDPRAFYIPAHIWTPWFGMFGSKSGFDSIQECFDELAPEIKAIETGLSSDPAMNRQVKNLEGVTITSHSDAHSPQKLGREATLVHADLSYDDVIGALKTNDNRLVGTVEFYPEEGKYHADGHRACNVRFTPEQTAAANGICPVCGKPLVVGVQNRLNQLAAGAKPTPHPKKTEYIIPLAEVIAELKGTSTAGKGVMAQYHQVLGKLGDEFTVLRNVPIEAIKEAGFPLLALAVERLRSGDVVRDPGYDGVFGTIKVFKSQAERQESVNQLALL
jgi:DNA helicase-2/ATP-dependent DNA helicase PcrA